MPDQPTAPVSISLAVLALLTLICGTLLALPVLLPIGAMYWDSHIYLDALQRIGEGQVPSVDFFAPVGPLGYYATALIEAVLPNAQPVLAASWSIGLVTIPLMGLIAIGSAREHSLTLTGAVLVFAFFTLIPFNTTVYYPFPGADGFGIYNRHGAQLLFVLVTAFMVLREQRLLAAIVALAMLALFLTKITAFLAGGLICAFALIAGRIKLGAALASALIFVIVAGILELLTSLVSAYLRDIFTLVSMNEGGLLGRMLQAGSRTAGTSVSAGLLFIALLVWGRAALRPADPYEQPGRLDHPALWVAVVVAAGLFYESQNTGSQELIFLWPVALSIVFSMDWSTYRPWKAMAIGVLCAAATLPLVVNTTQHSLRALVAMVRQTPLAHDNLGPMGAVTVRHEMQRRATGMRAHYRQNRPELEELVGRELLPSKLLYSDFDFQITHMQAIDTVVSALRDAEENGLAYQSIMSLDFTNPFPWLLGKSAPRHVTIGADPSRAVPPLDEGTRQAVIDTDIILEPACPYTNATRQLREHYAPALGEHKRVQLTPCYFAWVHPRLAGQF